MFQYSVCTILPLAQFKMVAAWIVSAKGLVTVTNVQPKNKKMQACKKHIFLCLIIHTQSDTSTRLMLLLVRLKTAVTLVLSITFVAIEIVVVKSINLIFFVWTKPYKKQYSAILLTPTKFMLIVILTSYTASKTINR